MPISVLDELNGVIFVHHGPEGAQPAWRVPVLPEASAEGWVLAQKKLWRIRTHAQEIAENVADPTHFRYVHSTLSLPEVELTSEGHVFRVDSKVSQPCFPKGAEIRQASGAFTPRCWKKLP